MKKICKSLFEYNKWRWEKVFKCLRENPNNDISFIANNNGLYFNSIKGTLNHIIIADCLWLMRLTGQKSLQLPMNPSKYLYPPLNVETGNLSLLWKGDKSDEITNYFQDFDDRTWLGNHILRAYDSSDAYIKYINSLSDKNLKEEFKYRSTTGVELSQERGAVLFHVANHHTHHIGQVTAVITQKFDKTISPELDFTYYLDTLK